YCSNVQVLNITVRSPSDSPFTDGKCQDILRLLTLWFSHGATVEIQLVLQKGFSHVNINNGWLCCLR
ncbi:hypothetical protein MKX01_034809, partial [Papaver californicum]